MMKFHAIDLKIGTIDDCNGPEVQLLFSRLVRDVRMTANEAERYAYEIIDTVKKLRRAESANAGIDTGAASSSA